MEDRCVCCGAVVPEGRMVCPQCEMETEQIMAERRKEKLPVRQYSGVPP